MSRSLIFFLCCSLSGCLFAGNSDPDSNNIPVTNADASKDLFADVADDLSSEQDAAKGKDVSTDIVSDLSHDQGSLCGDGVLGETEECDGALDDSVICDADERSYGSPICSNECKVSYNTCRKSERYFTQLSVGKNNACAIMSDKTVTCWGSTDPTGFVNKDFTQVDVGNTITCGRKVADAVCWGRNGLKTGNIQDVVQIASGPNHRCFLRSDDNVYCVGFPDAGRNLPNLSRSSMIAAGETIVCGIVNGDIICNTENNASVATVASGGNYTSLVVVGDYACGIKDDRIECPPEIADVTTEQVRFVDGGKNGMCWIDLDGKVGCTGFQGSLPSEKFSTLSVGATYACGIVKEGATPGEIKCWGTAFDQGSPANVNQSL